MKVKILSFFGLLVAGVGLSVLLGSQPVHASGESYKWINATTIEASGGDYPSTVQFRQVSSGTYTGTVTFADGSSRCQADVRLSVGTDFIGANVTVSSPDGPICEDKASGFDKRIQIADPQKGPPMEGSEIDYATVDCAAYYEGGDGAVRCAAVKACIVDKGLAKDACLRSWNTCLVNRTVNGQVPAAGTEECATLVAGGQLDEASKGANAGGDDDENSTCRINGIGWIICPVVIFISTIADFVYNIVDGLLAITPLSTSTDDKLFQAWATMRNFANIAFVIAFLAIIFSQVSNVGINNYGIKKMLPKLVVAAILVNVSYWICAIAVDLSNILGGSLKGLLTGIKDDMGVNPAGFSWLDTSSGLLGGFIAGAAVTGAAFYVGLSVLLPMVVVVVATIITVFFALILRQVLVIILIVISPLAFVAYLLPNTESMFKKWLDVFKIVLLMYPIVALLFGGSALASTIIMASSDEFFIQVAGAGAAVIPLIAAPALIGAINKVANRFGLPNVGVKLGGAKKRAEGYRDYRKNVAAARRLGGTNMFRTDKLAGMIRGDGSSRFRRGAGAIVGAPGAAASWRERSKRTQQDREKGAEPSLNKAWNDYKLAQINQNPNFANTLAGPTGDAQRLRDAAEHAQVTVIAEEVKAASAKIEKAAFDLPNLREIANGRGATQRDAAGNISGSVAAGDKRAQQAAIQKIAAISDIGGIQNLVDNAHTLDAETRNVLADSLQANKPTFMSATGLNNVRQGTQQETSQLVESAINAGAYSATKLAKADKDEVSLVATALVTSTNITNDARTQVTTDATTARTDPRFASDKNRANLQHIENGTPGNAVT